VSRHTKPCREHHCGISLVELLVVIAIIGLLVALTIPAVQAAREAARRTQCASRLQQIGTSIHSFQSSYGYFPPGAPGDRPDALGTLAALTVSRYHSPHLQLLPYLDQNAVYNSANLTLPFDGLSSQFVGTPENLTTRAAVLEVFLCPSDNGTLSVPHAPNNYRANMGPSPYYWDTLPGLIGSFPEGGKGAFRFGFAVRPSDFTDGLHNTVMMSEKLLGDNDGTRFTLRRDFWCASLAGPDYPPIDQMVQICDSPPAGVPPHVSRGGVTWYYSGYDSTWYNHTVTPNSHVADCKVNGSVPDPESSGNLGGVFGATSRHHGGVYCLFADGAARFVSDSINLQTWRALSTRSGGESSDHDSF
jgi:prepilin-type N-terminal cleavage/methylation domain-containing protein